MTTAQFGYLYAESPPSSLSSYVTKFSSSAVSLRVGNTYSRLDRNAADMDRSGRHLKIHQVVVYVDVADKEQADLVESVSFNLGNSFSPRQFHCTTPVPTKPGGQWRFSTKQSVYGAFSADISVRFRDGTAERLNHNVVLRSGSPSSHHAHAIDRDRLHPFRHLKLSPDARFGIELELTTPRGVSVEDVASALGSDVYVASNYDSGRQSYRGWKIVPDSSIVCGRTDPYCNTFELVSPVLSGGAGLSDVHRVLNALQSSNIMVNRSMGFHVHVDVSELSSKQLVKVCQNYCKYEDLFDQLLPLSRRTGSTESNQFFKSNRDAILKTEGYSSYAYPGFNPHQGCHDILAECENSIAHLAQTMNPGNDRYYKLNLQNLATGRQPTLEFRQHSATARYDKVSHWIRLCLAFVQQSARLASPSAWSRPTGPSMDTKFDMLFYYVIKDRALRDFYTKRRQELAADGDDHEGSCCNECASGRACAGSRNRPLKY